MNNYVRLTLKVFLWIIASIIMLVLLIFVLVQVPAVQDWGRRRVVSYIENKIKTPVQINKISLDLPKSLVLEDVYFQDQNRDTLLAGDTLKVDLAMLKLLKNEVQVNLIDLRGVTANVNRTLPDSAFNFDYILKAFVKEQAKDAPPPDSAAALKFSLDKINLDRIHVNYRDEVSGSDVRFGLVHFDTRVTEFDSDRMRYNIPKMKLSGLNAKIYQRKPVNVKPVTNENTPSITKTDPEARAMDLTLGTIDLSDINLDYKNDITAINTQIDLGKLLLQVDKIDIANQDLLFKSLELSDTKALLGLGKVAKQAIENTGEKITNEAEKGWTVRLNDLSLKNNDIKFDDLNQKRLPRGIDFMHLDIKNLNGHAQNVYYDPKKMSGRVTQLSMTEKSGLDLKQLRGDFLYGDKQMYLDKMYVQTSRSVLKNKVKLSYNSLESLVENPGNIGLDINLQGSRIGFRDVLLFVPGLATVDPFKRNPNLYLNINGKVTGKVNDMRTPGLYISGLTNTRIRTSGRITGLPDMSRANFNLSIGEFSSGSRDLNALVSRGIIPPSIRVPQNFTLTGNFNGSADNFKTNLSLTSSIGSAKTNATMRGSAYNATFSMVNFNLGRLMKQEATMGRFTGSGKVTGSGFNPKTLRATYNVNAQKAELYGYGYRNLVASGSFANQNLVTTASLDDPNARLNLKAKANLRSEFPSVSFTLNVDSANLQALKLYNKDLRFHGKIVGDLPSTNPDRLIGTVDASDLIVAANGKRYQLDSIAMAATATGDQRDLRVRSQVLTGNLTGRYKLTEVGNAFTNEINKYFQIGDIKTVRLTKAHDFTFAAHLNNHPLLQQFVPSLTALETADINGNLNSSTGTINLTGNVPQATFMGYSVNNLHLDANTTGGALNYMVNLDQAGSASLQVNKTTLSGKAQNNQLDVNLNVKDAADKDRYQLIGLFTTQADQYRFSFNPGGLMLNYDKWTVSPDNSLEFGKQGILARNFELSRNGQRLSVNSNPQALNAPLSLNFTNFKIETLTSFAQKDSLFAGGVINGNAQVSNLNTSPIFTADLNVKNFNFNTDTVGDISLLINNRNANTLAATARITGRGNDVTLIGNYYINEQEKLDLNLDIANLNLQTIEGFSLGNLRNTSGSINGDLKITGDLKGPIIRGDVNFNQAAFTVSMINGYFQVDNESVRFTSEGVEFDTFTLKDSMGNTAVVDGILFTTNYLHYGFSLDVTTDNFKALNSTKKDNDLYYGSVVLTSDFRIEGDMNNPVVDGSVLVNGGTDFTLVLPQNNPAVVERQGIVEFIDMDNPASVTALTSNLDSLADTLNRTNIMGMNMALNIEVDSTAIFNIVIDEGNGDFLEVQGDAQLTAGVDPSGKISLTGSYELTQGAYEMSYNFIRRRFAIERGSSITWMGEPTEADVNVTAIYVSNTSPLGLVDNYLGTTSAAVRNTYKQRLPFEVYLTVTGQMLKPEITFDIGLPAGRNYYVSREVLNNVEERLTQLRTDPNELNKQVFSLLLLNRFSGENPFDNTGEGGGVEAFARQSVSMILTDQLNSILGSPIEGVDLNFNLVSSEDYTTGDLRNRTDLNVGLSKQLLNDRLKVTIGSNFNLEGPQNSNRPGNEIAGDIALDYQLSQDGRYMLRAYRKNVTDAIVEGYVVETGVGFIMSMDYTKFKELFMRPPKEVRRLRKEEKENRKRKKQEEKQLAQIEN